MNKLAEQNQIQIKMNELLIAKTELETSLARLLLNNQPYMAHMAELLDVCNEINLLYRGY